MPFSVLNAPSNPQAKTGATIVNAATVAFRLWAPNASAVTLLIRDNNGSPYTRLALRPDGAVPSYWSADISGAVVGNQYRYEIVNNHQGPDNPGGTFGRIDPYALGIENDSPEAAGYVVSPVAQFSPFRTPYFEDFLIYQLHIGSFAGYNDNVTVNNRTATFRQIADAKVQWIADMKFSAVQLLPTCESPPRFSESYSPSNFFAPDTDYGIWEDQAYLVNQCHLKGLAVLVDVVYNHVTGNNADDRLRQFDGNTVNNGNGIYFSDRDFDGPVPDFDRPEVCEFFFDNACQYLGELNVDGIRFDSAHNIYGKLTGVKPLQDMIGRLRALFPDKLILAEHNDPGYAIGQLDFAASWEMGSCGDFVTAVQNGSLDFIARLIDFRDNGVPHAFNLIRYLLGSHDDIFSDYSNESGVIKSDDHAYDRYFVEKVGGVIVGRDNWDARAKARMGWALTVVSPCTPMMFMGSECHHHGYWNPGFDAYPGDHRVDWTLELDPIGVPMETLVKDANSLRWNNPALRTDSLAFTHHDYTNRVIGFKRWNDQGNVLLVAANFSDNEWHDANYRFNVGGDGSQWKEIFNSQSPQYGGYTDSGNYQAQLSTGSDGCIGIRLPKWSILVFQLQ